MVLAYDEIDYDEHVVSKRLFDVEIINSYNNVGLVAFTVDGCTQTILIDGGHTAAASDRLRQARALAIRSSDDSHDEPPDFDVPGDDFGS